MVRERRANYRYREARVHRPRHRRWLMKFVFLLAVLGAVGFGSLTGWKHLTASPAKASTTAATQTATNGAASAASSSTTNGSSISTTPATNECSTNTGGVKLILVSISKRHLWACNDTTLAYNSAVITGMENLAADLTPTGTYKITSKTTNTHLIGSDSTGHWDDFVNYWMPFLHNQYGTYGFHDATWRDPSAFGNISPYTTDASHGCVETPLGTAKWLYDWAPVGTKVTIES